MAKVNFGLVISEARGTAGEVVYSRNRGGAYIRKTPYYVQDITTDVAAVRAIMKEVGAMWWNTLTDAQRTAWIAFGQNIAWKDIMGGRNTPSGPAIFAQVNFNLLNAGGSVILNPPPNLIATDPGPISVTAIADDQLLWVEPKNPLPPNYAPLLWATQPLNPGWSFFNRFLRQLGRNGSPVAPATIHDATPAYLAKFGSIPANKKIGVGLQYVNLLTGAKSGMQTALVNTGPADIMQKATVTLTPSQIANLFTTPAQILPPPGLGLTYVIHGFFFQFNYAAPAYTHTGTPQSYYGYGSSALGATVSFISLLYATANKESTKTGATLQCPTDADPSLFENQPIVLYLAGAFSSISAGGGSLTVTVFYSIIPA